MSTLSATSFAILFVSTSAHLFGGYIDFNARYNSETDMVEFITVQPDASWFGILLGNSGMD